MIQPHASATRTCSLMRVTPSQATSFLRRRPTLHTGLCHPSRWRYGAVSTTTGAPSHQALRWVATTGSLTFANAITWQAPGDLLFQPIFVLAFVAIAIWCSRPLIAASMAASYVLASAFI